ncbi:MAG TPA: cytochrome C oxidase subunit I [Deltaproteobacteria bacterium]|nr:cytochrome C oxidase subunit I [Deltaproteobacteria bacterium]
MSVHAVAAPSSGRFSLKEWIFTTDHKRVGVLYLIGSFAAFLVAGIMAMLMRTELASVGPTITENPMTYNTWLYFHGAAMILGFQIPALTGFFANYLVPLQIGARDVAFPRVNALSVWLYWMGIVLALLTFVIPDPPDIMWTGYPPYSIISPGNTALYTFTVLIIGFSSIAAGVNFLVTIIYMRAPGMTWGKLNIFIWCIMASFIIQLIFVPMLGVAVTMLSFDKYLGTNFFNPAMGGDVLLYENLFWFYSHPAVYVILLPAMGVIYEITATFARNSVFNYKGVVYGGIWGTVILSGIVWAHHLYIAGIPDWQALIHVFFTLLISVPVGLLMIGIVGTLYKGAIDFKTPMLYAIGFMFLFLIGGLTGIPNAMSAIYIHLTDTYWMPGHFHYVMAVSMTVAILGGVYYLFPKMTGRMYHEGLGKLGFWLFFIGVNITFALTIYLGYLGMPRRYYDYSQFPEFEGLQSMTTLGSYLIFVAGVVILLSWIVGLVKGEKVDHNPWGSKSLEWTHAPSPPPCGNWGPNVPELDEAWSPYGYGKGGEVEATPRAARAAAGAAKGE